MEYGELASDTLSTLNNEDNEQIYAAVPDDKANFSAGRTDFITAKEFLSVISPKSNLSLYDHLTALLKKIIRERIENSVDIFEDLSQRVKSIRYVEASTLVEVLPPDEKLLSFIKHFKTLIEAVSFDENEAKPKVEVKSSDEEDEDSSEKAEDEEDENEEEIDAFNLAEALPDVHLHMSRLSLAGIGLSTEEIFNLTLALKVLVRENKLEKVRFWGKIFGSHCNFYVVEALYKDNITPEDFGLKPEKPVPQVAESVESKETSPTDEDEADEENEEEKDDDDEENDEKDENEAPEAQEENVIPPVPVLKPRAKAIPPEENGTGVNEYVYFVCSKIGEPWRCLPSLRPMHVVEAKQIKQYIRGNLAADVRGCIYFSGKEAHYLRAQIARITASTCISLKDYYTVGKKKSESDEDGSDEDDDEENEDDSSGTVNKNEDFQPPSTQSVFSAGLDAWVHCRPAILDQGRCTWMGMVEEKEEKMDEEVDEEASEKSEDSEKSEEEKKEEPVESDIEFPPETAVPPLRSLSEDKALGGFRPWSIKMSSKLMNETSVLVVRSNIWPGAYTYYDGKTFETIYIGYGHKFSIYHYAPPIHSEWQKEYPFGPEITERIDYPIPVEEPPDEEEKDEGEGDEESEDGSSSGSSSSED